MIKVGLTSSTTQVYRFLRDDFSSKFDKSKSWGDERVSWWACPPNISYTVDLDNIKCLRSTTPSRSPPQGPAIRPLQSYTASQLSTIDTILRLPDIPPYLSILIRCAASTVYTLWVLIACGVICVQVSATAVPKLGRGR